MKIEQLIARYLFLNRSISLQQIGTFTIATDVSIPAEADKDFTLPEGSVIFQNDPKAIADEGFIAFIMEQTRKIRPLATSDLESFTMLGKQFMNIGKPLHLEGLGQLLKNPQAGYEFVPFAQFHSRLEAMAVPLKEKEKTEVDFSAPPRKKGYPKWMGLLLLGGIALILFAVLYAIRQQKNEIAEKPVMIERDSPVVQMKADSTNYIKADSLPGVDSIVAKTDSPLITKNGMAFIIREFTNNLAAKKTYDKLTSYGHSLQLESPDSTKHFIVIQVEKPLADSARVRDSLKTLFGGLPRLR